MLDAPETQLQAPQNQECDVLVVGGGPAGSTVAAVLAARGRDVVVLEKDSHPRFHIGESLLPANLPLFKRLGLAEAIHELGVFKPGAEFVSDYYDKTNRIFFVNATHLIASHAYQVVRADFDKLLFDNARQRGARTVENTRVTEIAFGGERATVTATGADGTVTTWRPRFVVDATGRDALMAGKLGLKQANKENNTAAVYGHFKGVPRRDGDAAGIITIHLVDGGWFWMIPLPDDVMSVGLVSGPNLFKNRTGSIDDLFWSVVRGSPSASERMKDAVALGPLTTTGNYSYSTRPANQDRLLLIGDAFTFVDPIFSSGVLIAMTSGELGAQAVDAFLTDEAHGRSALRTVERRVRRATDSLAWMIYRINDPVMRHLLLHPTKKLRLADGVVSMLAGEFFEQSFRTRATMAVFKVIYHALRITGAINPPAQRAMTPEMSRSTSGAD